MSPPAIGPLRAFKGAQETVGEATRAALALGGGKWAGEPRGSGPELIYNWYCYQFFSLFF